MLVGTIPGFCKCYSGSDLNDVLQLVDDSTLPFPLELSAFAAKEMDLCVETTGEDEASGAPRVSSANSWKEGVWRATIKQVLTRGLVHI